MTKKFVPSILILGFLLMTIGPVSAEADETTFTDSTLTFVEPETLAPDTYTQFLIMVYNAAPIDPVRDEWIKQVSVFLPEGYIIDESVLDGPACLHPGEYCDGSWDVRYDEMFRMITYSSVGFAFKEEFGDIREQDVNTFVFHATTDHAATGGFQWELWGDGGTVIVGNSYIDGDDDDTTDDDTADDDDDDDDDNDDDDDDFSDDDDDDSDDDFASDDDTTEPEGSREDEDNGDGCGC